MPPTKKRNQVAPVGGGSKPSAGAGNQGVDTDTDLVPVGDAPKLTVTLDPPDAGGDAYVDLDADPGDVEDGFAALFDNVENHYVDVSRLSPLEWQGYPCGGHVGRLATNDSLETIRLRFGGGRYRLNKRSEQSGRIVRTATVDVAGAPLVGITFPADPPATGAAAPMAGPATPVMIDVNGVKVPLPQSSNPALSYMQEVVLWSKMMEQLFPPRLDPNAQLLSALIDAKLGGDKSDAFEMFTRLKETFPELFDRSDVGSANWMSILQETIKQAGGVISSAMNVRTGARVPVHRNPVPVVTAPAKEIPEKSETAAVPAAESESNLTPAFTDAQIGLAHLHEVVKAFRLEPPKEPPKVVRLLDQLFQLTPERRERIKGFRDFGLDWCENQLEDVFAEDPSQRAEFGRYYTEIFDEYTRTDRQASFIV